MLFKSNRKSEFRDSCGFQKKNPSNERPHEKIILKGSKYIVKYNKIQILSFPFTPRYHSQLPFPLRLHVNSLCC